MHARFSKVLPGILLTAWLCSCQAPTTPTTRRFANTASIPVPAEVTALTTQASGEIANGNPAAARKRIHEAVFRMGKKKHLIDTQAIRSLNQLVDVLREISPALDQPYADNQVIGELERLYGRLSGATRKGTYSNRIFLLMKLANGYEAEGDFPSTLETHLLAYSMANRKPAGEGDLEEYRAWGALLVGKAYLRMQETQKARRHMLMAMEIFRKRGQPSHAAFARAQLARIMSLADAHDQAIEQALEAQREYQRLLVEDRDRYYPEYGRILQVLGTIYRRMEGFKQAIAVWEQALTISNENRAQSLPDSLEERIALLAGLGLCYEEMDNQVSADWAYGMLYEECIQLPDPPPLFWSFNLGEILAKMARRYSYQGAFPQAANAYHLAVTVYESVPSKTFLGKNARIASAQYGRGVALYQSDQFAEAEVALVDSVTRLHKLVRALPPEKQNGLAQLSLGVALAELGQTLTSMDRYRESAAVLKQAINLLENLAETEPSTVREYIYALSIRAKMYEATERYRLASEDVEHCVEIYASLPGELADQAEALAGMVYLQSALLARNLTGRTAGNSQVVRQRIKLGLEIAQRHPDAPYIKKYIQQLGLTLPEPVPQPDEKARGGFTPPIDLPDPAR
ncbi:MAG: tetratricopeptide (TPR) repeat protein [Kiritimatiellia bacterium]|jgi:tetratricopeptide (TPR) repeat protein